MTKIFPASEVQNWLAENLPSWQLKNGSLLRVYKTSDWRVTLMVTNAISYVAEAADHHPELILNYSSVEARLSTHDAGGITAQDYALARKIEESVLWRPGPGDALTGPVGKWVE